MIRQYNSIAFNLETAVGPSQKVQDFESESFVLGAAHSQRVLCGPNHKRLWVKRLCFSAGANCRF